VSDLTTDTAPLPGGTVGPKRRTNVSGNENAASASVPESIRRALEARIADKGLQPGHRLGLKSALQQEFGVAGPTIDQALQLLVSDGLIAIRRGPGGGVFVARSRPVLRQGSKQLWAHDVKSLTENIELRETLTALLGVSAARARPRDPDKLRELVELADAINQRDPSFDTQRLIWRGHHLLAELSDNATLRFIYINLLDAAESLIVKVEIPDAGPAVERERERVDAHAALFRAVVGGDVEAAGTFGETVVSVEGTEPRPARLWSRDGSTPV
jgi:DNA-binding FadR family transcriptional regulator